MHLCAIILFEVALVQYLGKYLNLYMAPLSRSDYIHAAVLSLGLLLWYSITHYLYENYFLSSSKRKKKVDFEEIKP